MPTARPYSTQSCATVEGIPLLATRLFKTVPNTSARGALFAPRVAGVQAKQSGCNKSAGVEAVTTTTAGYSGAGREGPSAYRHVVGRSVP